MISKDDIKKVIPQREPFLFVDCITAVYPDGCDGTYVFDEKNEVFEGHFPDAPVVPGVLLLEALAQTGAYFLLTNAENKGKNALLLGVNNAKFKSIVKPGDLCEMFVRQKSFRFGLASCGAELRVNGKVAVTADLACMLVDKEKVN